MDYTYLWLVRNGRAIMLSILLLYWITYIICVNICNEYALDIYPVPHTIQLLGLLHHLQGLENCQRFHRCPNYNRTTSCRAPDAGLDHSGTKRGSTCPQGAWIVRICLETSASGSWWKMVIIYLSLQKFCKMIFLRSHFQHLVWVSDELWFSIITA